MATRPIDEKIVVMKLDNSDFKQKAVETTGLFGKLRDSLNKIPGVNLNKTTQELGNIGKQTKGINMDGLSSSLQTVTGKFTAMGIVGVTALTNITNKAINAGTSLTKSLSVDQVMDGFREYETKIGSIGTVLSNTEWAGTSLTDVKRVLEDLNQYADKTVYSFGQMTENIGRFTAAGVGIDDSATAIKGLSNLAASSGSNVEQLNTAMYQMSQSMASGTMNLMDWNSLVNAGMGGKKTQDALMETAKAMGVNIDMSDGFRNSISDGWLTSEIFLETLKKFGKDKSMTEAATSVRTFSAMMDSLKESIGSGWATTWESIFGDFEEATKFWTGMSNSVTGFFSKSTEARNKLVAGIADKGGFTNIFDGIQNAVKPVIQVFGALTDGFKKVFPPASVDQIVTLTQRFKEFTSGLTLGSKQMTQLTNISQGIFSIFSTIWEIAKRLGQAFVQLIPEGTGSGVLNLIEKIALMAVSFNESVKAGNGLTTFIDGLGNVLGAIGSTISNAISNVVDFSGSLKDNLGKAVDWISSKLAPFGKFLQETFGDMGGDDLLGAGTLVGAIAIVASVISKITGAFEGLGDITDGIGDVFDGIGDAVQNFSMGIKIANLVLIAVALGILAVSLKTLEGIKTEDITKGLTALAVALGVMIAGMMIIDKFNVSGGLRVSITLIALATAVSIMASALKKISDLNPQELATGVGGLVAITGALALAVIAMGKLGGKIGTSSLQLIALSGAIYILASAVAKMSEIDAGSLFTSIGAMSLIFAQLAIFLKVVDGSKFGLSSALGLIAVSGAIHLMVSAIQKIDAIDTGALVKGLTTIAVILAQIAIFSKVAGGPQLLLAGAGMLLIAGALTALMGPISTLSEMSWEELVKGLGGMAVALVAVAGAAMLMSGSMAGALGLVVMAGALNLLIGPIERFAAMTWGEMLKGFVGLAGGMALLAGASILLTPAVPAMLAFGAGLLVMGVAILAAGTGMALFGAGLTALAVLTATSIGAIVSALALLIKGLAELIPAAIDFVVKLGSALVTGIRQLVPQIVDTVAYLVIRLLETIVRYLPRFLELGVTIVVQLIEGIAKYVPILVEAGLDLIIKLIQALSDAVRNNGPILIATILELLGEILLLFIEAGAQVITALLGWIPGVTDATAKMSNAAEESIRENFGAEAVAKAKGEEFNKALAGKKGGSKTAGAEIAKAAKEGAQSIDMTTVGANYGTDIAAGIRSKISNVRNASTELANASTLTMRKTLDTHSPSKKTDKIGQDTGQGFANGISKKKKAAETAAKKAATAAQKAFAEKMADAKYQFEMEKINSEEYIAELEKIKKAYSKVPANVRKVDLEIKKIQDNSAKEREKSLKAQTDAEKKAIDDRKYYNELSLNEELKAWLAIMYKYKVGTEERAAAEREVYRLKNEINNKLTSENDAYMAKVEAANKRFIDGERALNEEYKKAVDDRTSQLTNFAGIFDKVADASKVTGQELIDNLKGQVSTFTDWSNNIKSLASKGIDEGLLEELRQMGPKAAGEIAALNTLTEAQLVEYSGIWKTKNKLARSEATTEMEGLRLDTITKIAQLRSETTVELNKYIVEWQNNVAKIRNGTEQEFIALSTSMKTIGVNSIQGLMDGMKSMEGPLMEQAMAMANVISSTITGVLDINSPSKVTMDAGEESGNGLIVGMANKVKDVAKGAKSLALAARDSLHSFLDGFDVEPEDSELHFKAVIDYDKLDTRNFGELSPVMVRPDTSFANNSIEATKLSKRQNDNIDRREPVRAPSPDQRPVEVNQNLNFYSQQLTPSQVARKTNQSARQLVIPWGV